MINRQAPAKRPQDDIMKEVRAAQKKLTTAKKKRDISEAKYWATRITDLRKQLD